MDFKKADNLGVNFKCMDTSKQLSVNCYKQYWKKNFNKVNLKVNSLPKYKGLLSTCGQNKTKQNKKKNKTKKTKNKNKTKKALPKSQFFAKI